MSSKIFEQTLLGMIHGHNMTNIMYKNLLISRLRTMLNIDDIQDYLPLELTNINDITNKYITFESKSQGTPMFLFFTYFSPPKATKPVKASFLINIKTSEVFLFQINISRTYFENTILFGYFYVNTFICHQCLMFEGIQVYGAPNEWHDIISHTIINDINNGDNVLKVKMAETFYRFYDETHILNLYIAHAHKDMIVRLEHGPSRFTLCQK